MFTNEGYALLIGVDDYSAYDNSRHQPAGTSDLLGSRNDVRVFWRILRGLGMPASHIRVLTSPSFGPADLEGSSPENFAEATEAQIKTGIGWLADRMAQHGSPNGLLTYSGHGDFDPKAGLLLCPSDVAPAGDDLAHALPFGTINTALAKHAKNLTVVLDTCHAAAATPGTGRPLSLRRHHPDTVREKTGQEGASLVGRVLAAARRDQMAYQSMFDGMHRGAFSWAICSAFEQWAAKQQGGNVRFDVSYGKVVETARRLLGALWFDQEPELRASAGIADLAFLRHGTHGSPDETTTRPDGNRQGIQIDSGTSIWRKVTLTFADPSVTPFATVYIFNVSLGGFTTGKEYWYINESSLSLLGRYNMSIVSADQSTSTAPPDPSYSSEQSFNLAESVTWNGPWTSDPVSGGSLYSGPNDVYLRLTKKVTGAGIGNITWYQMLPTGTSAANITPSGTFAPVSSVTIPGGDKGWDVSQSM
jgi:hypothetical protein